ncbi:MAG TPA: ABC transporter permease [bacterium]|nr:ABC transporter permease [bacterium]
MEALQSPKPYSFRREMFNQFRKNHLAMGGLILIGFFFVIALTVLSFAFFKVYFPADPNAINLTQRLLPPSASHLLGTDQLGRDVLSRMLHGSWISLTVGFVSVAIAISIGVLIGSVSGYFRGWVDVVLMRFVDIMMTFPTFFLILTVVALLGPGFCKVMIVIGLTSWTGTARFVRAEILSLRQRDFVQAALAVGAPSGRIILRHVLPNAMAPVLVSATLGVAGAVLTESGLSFLGFGVQPPQPTWGNILTEGRLYIFDAWWLTLFPGLAILAMVLAFNLCGEGIRDALDPRLRR